MNILLDTNVAIALDPLDPEGLELATPHAVALNRVASAGGHALFVHPSSSKDLDRDPNTMRREARRLLIGKYQSLPFPPALPPGAESAVGRPREGSNDWVDNQLLASVLGDAVDYLITEDAGIHRKASRLSISDRVLTMRDAVLLLGGLAGRYPVSLPLVDLRPAHSLADSDPLFATIREEYGEYFDGWLARCKREHRPTLVVATVAGELQALAILKHDDDEFGFGGRVLKLCTFKVSEGWRGNRYGELLLHAVLRYANDHGFDAVWVSVFPTHGDLISLFEDFGFRSLDAEKEPGERVFVKMLSPTEEEKASMAPFAFHVTFGPPAVRLFSDDVFVVPIRPVYHQALFPEAEQAPPLLVDSFGNAMRKAYLCHAPIRRLAEGSTLLFYRSGDLQAVTTVGVTESTLVSSSAPHIERYVGNRTVYSAQEIDELCRGEVLAILFRFDRILDRPLHLDELVSERVLGGPPQTITTANPEGIDWLRSRIEG